MAVKYKTIDEYLDTVTPEKRAALEKLRKAIRAAAPDAQECISYGVPAFSLEGKFLVGFAAAAKHCSFFPASIAILKHKDKLKKYDTSKGTIRFPPEKPLPATLVLALVKTRIEEFSERPRKKK